MLIRVLHVFADYFIEKVSFIFIWFLNFTVWIELAIFIKYVYIIIIPWISLAANYGF